MLDTRTGLCRRFMGIYWWGSGSEQNSLWLFAASDTDILGTDQDPVFQTQRVGIEAFKADVPDGVYAVYLYWTELTSENKREALV